MSLSQLLSRTVTITTSSPSGSRDDYGNQVDETTTVETVGELQQIQQRRRSEDDTGNVSDTTWLLVLPPGTEIAADSTVTVDGLAYEVDGDPWPVRNPRTGEASHIEVSLERVAGVDNTT